MNNQQEVAVENTSTRFDLLDGLRGIAAIAVMIFHYTQHNGLHWLGGAWVAVDLFFILSGFVIAHSYGTKIYGGMSFRKFLIVRLLRLGPLYFVGLAIGLVAILLLIQHSEAPTITNSQLISAVAFGLIWLPYFNDATWPVGIDSIHGSIFPLNDPAWSLFFELTVNIIFFLFLHKHKKTPSVKLVTVSFAIFIALSVSFKQLNPGWGISNFAFGFPRVIFEFFFGVLIYSLGYHKRNVHKISTILTYLIAITLILIGNSKLSFINSIFFVPLIVALTSPILVKGILKEICKTLGELSYPLYIIHFPIYRITFELTDITSLTPITQTIFISILCITLSLALAKADLIFRKTISRVIPS